MAVRSCCNGVMNRPMISKPMAIARPSERRTANGIVVAVSVESRTARSLAASLRRSTASDTGPVEAITATGANKPQILIFAIIPQLVPKFLAFILYQWDINIRMSTVIGFVGGGGIGQFFRLSVGMNQYAAAGMAVWAIVIMVWTMDYLSAKARERLT